MASWADKVQAGMDAKVNLLGSARLLLLEHVGLMLVVQKLNDRLPRVAIVHIVAKARGVNDGKTDCAIPRQLLFAHYHRCSRTFEELLLQFCFCNLNLNRLVDLLVVAALVVSVIFDGGGKKRVDECRLAEPGFTGDLDTISLEEVYAR